MNIESIKDKLEKKSIFYAEDEILNRKSVIGYEKKFRWRWLASELNTFIVATDFGDEEITLPLVYAHLEESYSYGLKNSGGIVAAICFIYSSNVNHEARDYCKKLHRKIKWAGFVIPIVINTETNEVFQFQNSPMWGIIFLPYFKRMINSLV